MLTDNSNSWLKYTSHLLSEEGGKSSSLNDTASKCAPSPGKIHTNKGVTYCTFKTLANSLGVTPVTYERFLNLTDEDVAKFVYSYYTSVDGAKFNDSLALAMTEAGWMSGPTRAYQHLYDALKELGTTVSGKKEAQQEAQKFSDSLLFDEYIKQRRKYLLMLMSTPKYSMNKGWITRLKKFYEQFKPDVLNPKKKIVFLLLPILLIGYLITSKNK